MKSHLAGYSDKFPERCHASRCLLFKIKIMDLKLHYFYVTAPASLHAKGALPVKIAVADRDKVVTSGTCASIVSVKGFAARLQSNTKRIRADPLFSSV